MLRSIGILALALVVFLPPAAFGQAQLTNAFPSLTFTQPVFLTHANDGTNRIFVVQQNGRIRVFPNNPSVTVADTFLNISDRIVTGGEQGLLGLAFHPDYATNGYFYVNYTAPSPRRTIISRFSVMPDNPNRANPASELRILEIAQPYTNHNGGMIMFGTDGYLYIGMGDGGSGGDPQNYAQNMLSLLGKMLRIDVNTTTGSLLYGIPSDNPFVGNPAYRAEIFASGLRNPWRFSQDAMTGQIWAGDVGQNAWEEIDLIESGLNYGWRCYEGNVAYNLTGCGPVSLYTFPVKVYPISGQPECSVTGGYVYRGQRRPDLVGRYLYGDYCSGKVWQFRYTNGQISSDSLLFSSGLSLSSFGVDEFNELYFLHHTATGSVHRFSAVPTRMNTIPVAPTNGSLGNSINPQLRWRSASGAQNYWLQVALDGQFTTIIASDSTLADTTAGLSGLDPETRYFWRVRVRTGGVWGAFSHAWSFMTGGLPGIVQLSSPPHAAAVADTVWCAWEELPGAIDYWFDVATDIAFTVLVHRDTAVVGTSAEVSGLQLDSTYYWRVRARNSVGRGPFSDVRSFRVLPGGVPLAVTLSSPEDSTLHETESLTFFWHPTWGAEEYWFELSLDSTFATFVVRDTAVGDTSRFVDEFTEEGLYHWRVRARGFNGHGPFSDVWVVTIREPASVPPQPGIPTEFALHQNFPNPFNPSTEIAYDLPRSARVRLTVTNLLGQEVRVLVDEMRPAGRHTLTLDASQLASGVYFYQLQAGEYSAVRKMVLMR